MKTITSAIVTAILLCVAGSSFAWTMQETQPAAPAPVAAAPAASAPAAAAATQDGKEQLIATVTGVEGIVRVNVSGNEGDWKRATVGMQVGENAEFRTGPRSAVRFTIPPDHTITLDRLGTVKVLQAINDNGVVRTQMGMKYGRTRYSIEAAGREHESMIVSPSNTLAVRGTDFSVTDQRPFPSVGVRLRGGPAEFRDRRKRVVIGRNAGKVKIDVNNPSAASLALGEAVVDPGARLARTAAEDKLVATLISSGATVEFDYDKGIRVVRGGQPPRTDAELIPTLPGALNFVLRWTQPGTDLNLGVFTAGQLTPQGEGIYPVGGANTTPSGGVIAFDHRGGPNGGIEVGSWPLGFPAQPYTFGSVHITGPNSPATMDVFQNGQRISFTGPDGQQTTSASYLAQPIPPEIATGQFVGFVNIAPGTPGSSAGPSAPAALKADRVAQRRSPQLSGGAAPVMGPRPPRVKKP
jgi:hypothetical protein